MGEGPHPCRIRCDAYTCFAPTDARAGTAERSGADVVGSSLVAHGAHCGRREALPSPRITVVSASRLELEHAAWEVSKTTQSASQAIVYTLPMAESIQILTVERDGEDGLIVIFSDGTLAGYVAEELLELRPFREPAAAFTQSAASVLASRAGSK